MARNLRLIESLWRYGIGGDLARFGCNLTRSVYLTLERNSVADIQYRLVYHRAQPGTKLLPFPGMAPVPVFLAPGTYLTKTDFVSARYESKNGNAFVRATLTPQAREKLNNLGAQNAA